MSSWVFQANPDIYRVDAALKTLSEHTWLVNQHAKHIKAGDEVFIWRCGDNAALIATGTILTDPAPLTVPANEQMYEIEPLKFDGARVRVKISARVVSPPLPRYAILKDPNLSEVAVFRGCTGTNFALTASAAAAINTLIEGRVTNAATKH